MRRVASRTAACPATTLAQVGESASSRQHMKTLAPELSALMTIFASAGPVSSTRRSSRSGGRGRDRPFGLAQLARLGRELRALAGGEARLALVARRQQREAARAEAVLELGDRSSASRSSSSSWPGTGCAATSALMRPAVRPRVSASARSAAAPPVRSGEPCVVRMRSTGSCARRRSAPASPRPAVPRALGGGAAVPAGRAHAHALGVLALDRVAADHDVADARARGTGAGHRPSLRSGRRGRSRARRRARRRRGHRSGRPWHRPRAGASGR